MPRTTLLLAAVAFGLTLLSGNGVSLVRHPAPGHNWASAKPPAAQHQPPAPRNWATPR